MHRLLWQQVVDETQDQIHTREVQLENLLHVVERYPRQAKELLYHKYLDESPDDDDDDDDDDDCTTSPRPNPRKRRRTGSDVRLEVTPGRGFELMQGPNVVMFYSKDAHRQFGRYPVIIKSSSSSGRNNRTLDFEQVPIDGTQMLEKCDRRDFFAQLETKGSGSFRHLIVNIARHLSVSDIGSCALVCRQWNENLKGGVELWKHHYARLGAVLGNLPEIVRGFRQACRFVSLQNFDGNDVQHQDAFRFMFLARVMTDPWRLVMSRIFELYFRGKVCGIEYRVSGYGGVNVRIGGHENAIQTYYCRLSKEYCGGFLVTGAHDTRLSFCDLIRPYVRRIH